MKKTEDAQTAPVANGDALANFTLAQLQQIIEQRRQDRVNELTQTIANAHRELKELGVHGKTRTVGGKGTGFSRIVQKPLADFVITALEQNPQGLSLAALHEAVEAAGWRSLSKTPRAIVYQGMHTLKTVGRVLYDEQSKVYKKIEIVSDQKVSPVATASNARRKPSLQRAARHKG